MNVKHNERNIKNEREGNPDHRTTHTHIQKEREIQREIQQETEREREKESEVK